jgi:hypothetical protein
MARAKPPGYDTEGFAGAHQARGLNHAAKKFLERKGALRASESRSSAKRAEAEAEDETLTNDEAAPEDAEGEAATEGDTRKRPARARSSSRAKTPRARASDAAPKEQPASPGVEMPRRNRKARTLQARHFRLPLDIDAKLHDLVDHYDATMVWVISKLIQEDWVRARRAQRRVEPDPAGEVPATAPAETPEEPKP